MNEFLFQINSYFQEQFPFLVPKVWYPNYATTLTLETNSIIMKYKMKTNPTKFILEILWYKMKNQSFKMLLNVPTLFIKSWWQE